jgi:putative AlgH/UPF0301 family transcriptional regulator
MQGGCEIASEQESKLDLSLKLAFRSAPVTYGGPVAKEEFSLLHVWSSKARANFAPGLIGGSEELMNEVRINRFDQALS